MADNTYRTYYKNGSTEVELPIKATSLILPDGLNGQPITLDSDGKPIAYTNLNTYRLITNNVFGSQVSISYNANTDSLLNIYNTNLAANGWRGYINCGNGTNHISLGAYKDLCTISAGDTANKDLHINGQNIHIGSILNGTSPLKVTANQVLYNGNEVETATHAASLYQAKITDGTYVKISNNTLTTENLVTTNSVQNIDAKKTFTAGLESNIIWLRSNQLLFKNNNDTVITINSSGLNANSISASTISATSTISAPSISATSIQKTGGTSTQFLKADGSVDSSTYSKATYSYDSSSHTLTITNN